MRKQAFGLPVAGEQTDFTDVVVNDRGDSIGFLIKSHCHMSKWPIKSASGWKSYDPITDTLSSGLDFSRDIAVGTI